MKKLEKSFFNYSDKEKRKIISKATKQANDDQYEMYHGKKRKPESGDWEEKLDKMFERGKTLSYGKVHAFISSLLASQREEIVDIYNRNLTGNITLETSYAFKRISDELDKLSQRESRRLRKMQKCI